MTRTRWIVAALVAVPLMACSDEPSGPSTSELFGLWAAVEMVYTSQADPDVEVELVGAEGATYSIYLRSDRTFESLLSGYSQGSVEETGTFEVQGGRLVLEAESGVRTWELDFNQALLTIHEAEGSWDFDGDGTDEPATLHMVLDRL